MADMSKEQLRNSEREVQRLKKAMLLVSMLILLLVAGAVSVILNRHLEKEAMQNREAIYGVWIEQNVPKFARDRFVVSEGGILVNERIIDTQYTFDGSELTYVYGETQYVYKVKEQEDESIALIRVKPAHYLSTFVLQGSEELLEADTLAEEAEHQ
ncbi:DUF2850 domain-containing protein [Vibrio hannami]|uniref:DUF2850 domain-containing protein n=1 Tax=Vibrio hannami TaxID=2717094 RepID=UPI00241005FA|nr:DUF2850 domain-containing protein [Vibrio hannami]MDG3087359.1 DUF2850 domain-containing protein [Vibrio hannami]